ncbi:hypothetical protein EYF80_021650 [Liparis tanakae]|uniref:Uncharacterized protein n=1 Tax=Liparis tanakae TaxID=230148 RepID=A0A4Z2HR23_9TELE|nr:hypothetical protein EYF80_021650 [Liparis tanakae]
MSARHSSGPLNVTRKGGRCCVHWPPPPKPRGSSVDRPDHRPDRQRSVRLPELPVAACSRFAIPANTSTVRTGSSELESVLS